MDRKNIFIVILGVTLIGAATFFIVYRFVLGNPTPVASNPSPAVETPMPSAATPEVTETPATTEITETTETASTVANSEEGQVILYNVDDNDRSKRLGGGMIALKNETSGESRSESFNENGEISLNLPTGKYTVTQVKAADGYELLKEPITLDVEKKEDEPGIPTISQEIPNIKTDEMLALSAETTPAAAAETTEETTTEEVTTTEEDTEEQTTSEETEAPSVVGDSEKTETPADAQQTNPNNPKTADVTSKFNASFIYFVFAYGILAYSFVYIKKNILGR